MNRGRAPVLYAHRGAAIEQPENTFAAFRRALECGADAIETDAHLTRDGHVVLSHDASGKRMAGVDARIRDCTLAEVRQWDVGWGFRSADGARTFAGKGIGVPTLEEVLVELAPTPLNVDLKQLWPAMTQATVSLLRRLRATERVTLASFHWRTLVAVRRHGYEGPTALSRPEVALLASAPRSVIRRIPSFGNAAQVPVSAAGVPLARKTFIDKCHQLGVRVDFWTINDAAHARALLALGADGIMTDDPAAIAPVFRGQF